MRDRKGLLAAFGLLFLVISCGIAATWLQNQRSVAREAWEQMLEVQRSLEIGLTRVEVEQRVQHAQTHYQCDYGGYGDFTVDIYLFGTSDPDLAGILYLRFEEVEDKEELIQITDIDDTEDFQIAITGCNAVS